MSGELLPLTPLQLSRSKKGSSRADHFEGMKKGQKVSDER